MNVPVAALLLLAAIRTVNIVRIDVTIVEVVLMTVVLDLGAEGSTLSTARASVLGRLTLAVGAAVGAVDGYVQLA
jgi:hypothetical protein